MAIREVGITLGGQSHVLRCDLGAWAAVEDQGIDFLSLLAELQSNGNGKPKISFRRVRLLLWALLDAEQPRPSVEQVSRWVTGENFPDVMEKLGEALRDAFPAKEGSANPPAAGPGPGLTPSI